MKLHTSLRAYAFECTYNSSSWLDDIANLVGIMETALNGISNFLYQKLIISSVKNASRKNIEVEIVGIIYNSKTKLNSSENDNLISDLTTAFGTITNFTFGDVNIVNDVFREDPTSGWI